MALDFIRVPLDSTGKRTAARSVTIPAGTAILDADGTQSTLASDTTCFVQQVVMATPVSDTPETYNPGDIQPLSMTSQGHLRVSATSADLDSAWSGLAGDPFEQPNPYNMETTYG